jgi:hypothetical protein
MLACVGRKAIAIELKESYFRQLVENMKGVAGDDKQQMSLFDTMGAIQKS